jgi:hypothetical protein
MNEQEIHDRWVAITEGGKADSRVSSVEAMFSELRNKLRSRYNTQPDVLSEIEALRDKVVLRVKTDIVLSMHWSGFGQVRKP